MRIGVSVLERERRVRYPELADPPRSPAEAGEGRGGLRRRRRAAVVVVQDLNYGLDGVRGSGGVVVEGFGCVSTREEGVVVLVTAAVLADVEAGEGGAVATAEFVLVGADGEGEVAGGGGGGRGAAVVVVEHEIADGFSGDFAALHHEIEVEDELALGDAFSEQEKNHAN